MRLWSGSDVRRCHFKNGGVTSKGQRVTVEETRVKRVGNISSLKINVQYSACAVGGGGIILRFDFVIMFYFY